MEDHEPVLGGCGLGREEDENAIGWNELRWSGLNDRPTCSNVGNLKWRFSLNNPSSEENLFYESK